MSRDLREEHRLAVEGLRVARTDYHRTRDDFRRRLVAKREWVAEAKRRLAQARAALKAGA
jgi:hypothetical protein